MGLEIDRSEFSSDEYERFAARLAESIELLRDLLARPGFGVGETSLGAELEVSLIDCAARPLPANELVLAESLDPRLTVELNRFNLESNLRHALLRGRSFNTLGREMEDALAEMTRAAAQHGGRIAMIGILPTLVRADLEGAVMTDSERFRALSAGLRRLRQEPFRVRIRGEDELDLECRDVTYEGAATSLQVHLRIDPDRFADVYDAVQLATPAVLAVSGNSPTFLGRRLWAETRVALFKQAVDVRADGERGRTPARVSFGRGWISGPLELFRDAVDDYPVLLPVLDPRHGSDVIPGLRELRLHQGTVWRWNRPVYDPADGGHLRVEMRSLPSGPSVDDMLANTAFHLGLALELAREMPAWRETFAFEDVHRDFYVAAREGLDAVLHWPRERGGCPEPCSAVDLVERLLPLAQAGLDRAGVDRTESERLLGIVAARAGTGQTGAVWQRRALEAARERTGPEAALTRMFERYLRHSADGSPVHEWPEFEG